MTTAIEPEDPAEQEAAEQACAAHQDNCHVCQEEHRMREDLAQALKRADEARQELLSATRWLLGRIGEGVRLTEVSSRFRVALTAHNHLIQGQPRETARQRVEAVARAAVLCQGEPNNATHYTALMEALGNLKDGDLPLASGGPITSAEEIWYFTFGPDNRHPITGESLGKRYVALRGTAEQTRMEMLRRFGRAWSSQYRDPDLAGIMRYGLTELRLQGNRAT